jgi:hypothetical protein
MIGLLDVLITRANCMPHVRVTGHFAKVTARFESWMRPYTHQSRIAAYFLILISQILLPLHVTTSFTAMCLIMMCIKDNGEVAGRGAGSSFIIPC